MFVRAPGVPEEPLGLHGEDEKECVGDGWILLYNMTNKGAR